jgi:putative ABC transport system permease protein
MRVGLIGSAVRDAGRSLGRARGFMAVAVTSIGIGLGAAVVAFAVVYALRGKALPFPDGDKLVSLYQRGSTERCDPDCKVSWAVFDAWRRSLRSVRALTAVRTTAGVLAGSPPQLLFGEETTVELFSMLGAKPILGRVPLADDTEGRNGRVVVLSFQAWTGTFGRDASIIGRQIVLSGVPHVVIGVTDAGFRVTRSVDYWTLLPPRTTSVAGSTETSDRARSLVVLSRLGPGVPLQRAIAEARQIAATVAGAYAASDLLTDGRSLRAYLTFRWRQYDQLIALIAGCILLVSFANLGTLVLSRATRRRREFAVRVALGAGRGRVRLHLFLENAIIGIVGAAIAVLLAIQGVALSQKLLMVAALELPGGATLQVDARAVVVAVSLGLLTSLLFALVSERALGLGGSAPNLLRTSAGAVTRNRTQRVLVAVEVACATVLLTASVRLATRAIDASELDLGYDHRGLFAGAVRLPQTSGASGEGQSVYWDELRQQLAVPSVAALTIRGSIPFQNATAPGASAVELAAEPDARRSLATPAAITVVDPAFFSALRIPIVNGRTFSASDGPSSGAVAVVSKAVAVSWWPGRDPVGQRFRLSSTASADGWLTVIGVAADTRWDPQGGALAAPAPEIYRALNQVSIPNGVVLLRVAGDRSLAVGQLRGVLSRLMPGQPVTISSVESAIATSLGPLQQNTITAAIAAMVVSTLAIIGVFGVVSYAVTQREKEIALRLALGADSRKIVRSVVVDGLALAVAGIAVGLVFSVVAAKLLESLLYGAAAIDLFTLSASSGLFLVIAAFASYLPARRAARTDPMIALRQA